MYNLKKFFHETDYENYINSDKALLPNISLIKGEERKIAFHPLNTYIGEVYFNIPDDNEGILPYSIAIPSHFKSFVVDGVEYVKEGGIENGDPKVININESVFTDDIGSYIMSREQYIMSDDVYSSIKITVPNFNMEADDIAMVLVFESMGEYDFEPIPGYFAQFLTPISDNTFGFDEETLTLINDMIYQNNAFGYNTSLYFVGVEGGYTMDEDMYLLSFTTKPTIIEYEGSSLTIYEFTEVGDYTAQVELKTNDISGISLYGWPIIGFNDCFFKGISTNDTTALFEECTYLSTINLEDLDASNITSTYRMFSRCVSLTLVQGIEYWNTSNVTDMSGMFTWCKRLTSIEAIENWNVSNVVDMSGMFSQCDGLISLNLSGWDTSNVTDMSSMFNYCSSFTSLESIKDWDVSKVIDMELLFYRCLSLNLLDLSNWDTGNVTNMDSMFGRCYGLTSLDSIKDWDVSKVTRMDNMFYYCTGLTSLDLSNWDTSSVTDMSGMFSNCLQLSELRMGGDVSNVTNVENIFDTAIIKTFYYNAAYDYSKIIEQLPSYCNVVACDLINSELVPKL